MPKLGVEVLSNFVVEALNVVHDIRDSLPKIGLEDLSRLWDLIKNGRGLIATDWRQAIAEIRDLVPDEMATLGELVEYKLDEQGIVVANIGLAIQKALTIVEASIDLAELLSKKPADSTT